MSIINKAGLEDLNVKLHEAYESLLDQMNSSVVGSILKVEPTDRPRTHFSFWDGVPHPREWTGERIAKNVKLEHVPVECKPHELTLEMSVSDYRSATFTSLVNKLEGAAAMQMRFPDREVAKTLANGTSTDAKYVGYDGKAIFATDHPLNDGGTQENLLTSSALSKTNLIAAYNKMVSFTDAEGTPLSIRPTSLVVPAGLALTAQDVLKEIDDAGATNILNALNLEIIVLPELDEYSTSTWYLLSGAPMVHFQYEEPHFEIFDDPKDPAYFNHRKVVMGWTTESATKFGLWQFGVRCEA